MVPHTSRSPSLTSTLPMRRCFSVLMMDEPMISVRPVPTAKTGGTPNTSKPPVIKNPPPTPKKPLRVPKIKPRSNKRGRDTATPALGNSRSKLTVPSGPGVVGRWRTAIERTLPRRKIEPG